MMTREAGRRAPRAEQHATAEKRRPKGDRLEFGTAAVPRRLLVYDSRIGSEDLGCMSSRFHLVLRIPHAAAFI